MVSNRQFKHPRMVQPEQNVQCIEMIQPDELMAAVSTGSHIHIVRWNGLNVVIRSLLMLNDVSGLINHILKMSTDDETKELVPEMVDFAMRFWVITYYSNIDLPDDQDSQYLLLYGTDLYDIVYENANHAQVNMIQDAVRMHVVRDTKKISK